ncbi:MAG: hypothetical protein NTZ50_11750 [Chloroflexi bacterium]|nr:hypothetical protein [Chloroflexota bacterium]
MNKLTPKDVAWLESRLRSAVQPEDVQPDPAFVTRARDELMHLKITAPRPSPAVLVAVAFSCSALVAALLLLMRRRMR